MKNTMKIFWLLAAASVVLSCSKEAGQNLEATPEEGKTPAVITPATDGNLLTSFGVTFEGDVQDEETKVSVNLGTGVTAMEENDEVLVFVDGENNAIYKYDGEKFVLKEGETAVALGAPASVYYPASEFAKTTAYFTMPAAIEASGDFGAINPMAGVISGGPGSYSVELGNIASVLRVQVSADVNINSVSLNFGSGVTYAAGSTFSVDASTKEMTAKTASTETTETVTLGTPGKAADVLFILPTLELSNGLTVTANLADNHNGGANSFSISKATYTPAANKISSMSFYAGLFSGGAGVDGDPYLIANARDFKNIQKYTVEGYTPGSKSAASFLGAYYQQTADIDFKNASLTPIGTSGASARFTGEYDGNSKKLQNVNINVSTQIAGVFGYLDGTAKIQNLTISGTVSSSVVGAAVVGGVAGILNGNAQVTGCTNQATVTATSGQYVGGIVGRLYSNTAAISACHNIASVSGDKFVGGIAGEVRGGKVSACENRGSISAVSDGAGGISGYFQGGTIKACYSSNGVLVSGTHRVGGIAGYQSNQGAGASTIINCAAKSQIKSTGDTNNGAAGGLVGYMYAAADKGNVILTNSVALGNGIFNTSQADSYLGAIVGLVNGEAKLCYVRNCYSQHNSTSNTSAAVYYSNDGSAITSTKQAHMGGMYGYLQKGTVQNCYCVGTDGANGSGINDNAVVGAGSKTSDGSTGNTRMISNAVKNGTATVNPSTWTIAVSNIKPTSISAAYLIEIMNLGTWVSAIDGDRVSYTSSEGTPEAVSEWVWKDDKGPTSYDPAYPKELKDLGFSL